jgi:glycosyltransferase involved in cell wall biosynthesis
VRVLVYAHPLELGGSQTNSIDLAAAVRDIDGHEVVLFAAPGPAAALAERKRLRLIDAPLRRHHPSPTLIRSLSRAVAEVQPDLIHAWEWQQILDAYYGPHLIGGVPLVGSNMSMSAVRSIPSSIPLTCGAPTILEATRRARSGLVELLEPPVDTGLDDPERVDAEAFVAEHGLDPTALRLVVVSRLVDWLKAEGIARAIDAIPVLRCERPVELVIVGEGTAATELRRSAELVNGRLGRRAVVLTGAKDDPRPAYKAADIMLGMGGSALRGMSFAKPTIVLGEMGFSEILAPETVQQFLDAGFYGIGDGDLSPARLAHQIDELAASVERRSELSAFARSLIDERYGLDVVAAKLERLYQLTLRTQTSRMRAALDAVRTLPYAAADDLPDGVRRRLRRLMVRDPDEVADPGDVYAERGRRAS